MPRSGTATTTPRLRLATGPVLRRRLAAGIKRWRHRTGRTSYPRARPARSRGGVGVIRGRGRLARELGVCATSIAAIAPERLQ
jgi:hypothetical protein